VFALNSINTTTKTLLKVDDLLKENFPPKGTIPNDRPPVVRIPFDGILQFGQAFDLQNALRSDPLSCGSDGSRAGSGLRADTITRVILKNGNPQRSLSLTSTREEWARQLVLPAEPDARSGERIGSRDILPLLLPPGKSGIVPPETYRELVLRKTSYGGL